MTIKGHYYASRDGDDHTVRESSVPAALRQLFERPDSDRAGPMPLDVFPPTDWPPCPKCAERLVATAVTTDAHDALVAAAMICYNSAHETRRYIYDVRTGDIYFDQVLADQQPTASDG